MSIHVMNLVWSKAPCQGNALLALLALADWSDDNGKSWPSVATLAKKSRQSERNCRTVIRFLQKEKLVSVEERDGTSNLFVINLTLLGGQSLPPANKSNRGGLRRKSLQENAEIFAPYTSLETSQDQIQPSAPLLFVSEEQSNPNSELTHVEEVFKYYLARMGRKPGMYTLTPLRAKKGMQRFRECMDITQDAASAVALMKLCVDKLAASEFHREGGYIEWDKQLFGSTEKLQMWMNRETRNGNHAPPLEDALERERRKEAERRRV